MSQPPMRGVRAALTLMAATGCLLTLAGSYATPALAQVAPAPSPASSPAPSGGGLMEQVVPQIPCPAAPAAAAVPGNGSPFPLSSYTIDFDEGGFTAIARKAVGTMTEMTFATVRWAVSVGTWLIAWAFSFGFANRLAQPMAGVAARFQGAFFTPLVGAALALSAAYGGVQVFRGRTGRGIGEFGASLLLVAVFSTWLLSDPQAFLDAMLGFTARLAGSVATVGLGAPAVPAGCSIPRGDFSDPGFSDPGFSDPGIGAAVAPLTAQIQQAFVRRPYELLEWGTLVPRACASARDAILSSGPGGNRDTLVSLMDRPGCTALYQFNREPSTERLGVAVIVLIASGLLMLSLTMVAGTVIAAQVVAVALIALLPLAALSSALPGGGRTATWRWATALVRSLTTIVVMAGFLTFLLLTSSALLDAGQGQSLLVQMATLNVVAILGLGLRHRMVRAGRLASSQVVRRLESTQPGLRAPRTAVDVLGFLPAASGTGPRSRGSPGPGGEDLAARVTAAVASTRASSSTHFREL